MAKIKNERVGRIATTNSGLKVQCIEYNRCDNIKIKFLDDGSIKRTTWNNFIKGSISRFEKAKIGEVKYNTIGLRMTVVAEKDNNGKISVSFDDGTIVKCTTRHFRDGAVKHPNFTKTGLQQVERLGMKKRMKNGLECKIVEYINSYNIKVCFEDGTKKKATYYNFIKGEIKHPNTPTSPRRKDRLHAKRKLKDGTIMEVIEYKNCKDMIVLINNKEKKKMCWDTFKAYKYYDKKKRYEEVGKNNSLKSKYLGKTTINRKSGEKMTIVGYKNSKNITVRFEDGTEVSSNVTYFKKGTIMNPNKPYKNRVSLPEYGILYYLQKHGFAHHKIGSFLNMDLGNFEIDCYNPLFKIGIEYDGYWHKDTVERDNKKTEMCKLNNIDIYRVREPNLPLLKNTENIYTLNDTKTLSDNYFETINELITNINLKYNLNIPCANKKDAQRIRESYYTYIANTGDNPEGMKKYLENGDILTITKYRSWEDIEITNKDGKVFNTTMSAFRNYSFTQCREYLKVLYEGSKRRLSNGDILTIVEYNGHKEVKVSCENGNIFSITMESFKKGKLIHNSKYLKAYIKGQKKKIDGIIWTVNNYENCDNVHIISNNGRSETVSLAAWKRGILKNLRDY